MFRKGIFTFTAGIAHGFVKTRDELASPDVQFHFAHASSSDYRTRALDREPGMTVGVCQLRPESTGSVHIKSCDPATAPAIKPNFLSTWLDRTTLVAGMKIARSVVRQPAFDRFRGDETSPGKQCEGEDELLDFARRTGQTVYHPVGTCKMGSDKLAVVDDRLCVHGIAKLRVIDGSVMPTLVSGNTNAAIFMIAERGAELIKDETLS